MQSFDNFSGMVAASENMAAILQRTFSNAFPEMRMYEFRLKFHSGLFLRGLINNTLRIGSDKGWVPTRRKAVIRNNDVITDILIIYMHMYIYIYKYIYIYIYTPLGLNELSARKSSSTVTTKLRSRVYLSSNTLFLVYIET